MIRLKVILYFAFVIWNFKECVARMTGTERKEAHTQIVREAKIRPISNNVTLEGTFLGYGGSCFVLSAWVVDKKGRSKEVAAKFEKITKDSSKTINNERVAFQLLGAHNPDCEYYGIPAIYCETTYLDYNVVVMTRLYKNVDELFNQQDGFNIIDVLILMRDLMPIFKYLHSRGLLHRDVKPENIMVDKDGNVYIMDFNGTVRKVDRKESFAGSRVYMWLHAHKLEPQIEADDLASLYIIFLGIGNLKSTIESLPQTACVVPWSSLPLDQMLLFKQDTDLVGELCNDMPGKLIPVCVLFFAEVIDSFEKKRIPNYDGLYELFDTYVKKNSGTTNTGQARFSWLSPSARPQQNRPRIGDIEFRRNDTHYYDFSGPLPEKRANQYIVKPENRRTWPPTPPPQQPPMQSSASALKRQPSIPALPKQSSNLSPSRKPSTPALSRQSSNRAPPRKPSTSTLERQPSNLSPLRKPSTSTLERHPSNLALSRQSSMTNRNRVDQDKNWERDSRERRERVPDARDDRITHGMNHVKIADARDEKRDKVVYIERRESGSDARDDRITYGMKHVKGIDERDERIVSGMKHLKVIDERDDRVDDGVRYVENRDNQASNKRSKPSSGYKK